MRWLSLCSAALVALVLLLVACDTVPDGDCWVNTSGGLGASGTIPIGAGVGAGGGSGDQRHAEKPNPCVTQGSDNTVAPVPPPAPPTDSSTAGADSGTELGTYIRCRGLGSSACAAECNAIGAYCVEYADHPKLGTAIAPGGLKQCMENLMSFTCTYCYSNGDVCSFICALKGICADTGCTNTGGKGCE